MVKELRPLPPESLPAGFLANEPDIIPRTREEELEELIKIKDLVIEKQIAIIKILNDSLTLRAAYRSREGIRSEKFIRWCIEKTKELDRSRGEK